MAGPGSSANVNGFQAPASGYCSPSFIIADGRVLLNPIPDSWKVDLRVAYPLFRMHSGFLDIFLTVDYRPGKSFGRIFLNYYNLSNVL